MNRATAALAIAVAAALLAGCSAPVESAPEPRAASTPDAQPSETVPPLVAETPTDDEPSDAAFLDGVRENLPPATTIGNATDEQLLAAGTEACERIAAGESTEAMSLIEDEKPNVIGTYEDSGAIIVSARLHLCAN